MTITDNPDAPAVDVGVMLAIWEVGHGQSLTRRGIALLGAAVGDTPMAELARLSIGQRDSALLTLHEALFGREVRCWMPCAACGAAIEVAFDTVDVRAPVATDAAFEVKAGDLSIRTRPADSFDLLAIENEIDTAVAERRLLERCIVAAHRRGRPVAAADVPDTAIAAVGAAMTLADPQAEILLDIACVECATATLAPFDIVGQTWARLDQWARAMLAAVDQIAARYGWSEAEILALSAARRQSYLDLIVGASP